MPVGLVDVDEPGRPQVVPVEDVEDPVGAVFLADALAREQVWDGEVVVLGIDRQIDLGGDWRLRRDVAPFPGPRIRHCLGELRLLILAVSRADRGEGRRVRERAKPTVRNDEDLGCCNAIPLGPHLALHSCPGIPEMAPLSAMVASSRG